MVLVALFWRVWEDVLADKAKTLIDYKVLKIRRSAFFGGHPV